MDIAKPPYPTSPQDVEGGFRVGGGSGRDIYSLMPGITLMTLLTLDELDDIGDVGDADDLGCTIVDVTDGTGAL